MLAVILMIARVLFFILGLIKDLVSVNRMFIADIKSNLRLSCKDDFKKYIKESLQKDKILLNSKYALFRSNQKLF